MSEEVEVKVTSAQPAGHAPSLFDGVRRLVLASIGAVAITRDEAEKVIDQLVERGELAQKEGERLTSELGQRLRASRAEVEQGGTHLNRQIEQGIEQVLGRLNIPSKREIDELTAKIAELNAQIAALKSSGDQQ